MSCPIVGMYPDELKRFALDHPQELLALAGTDDEACLSYTAEALGFLPDVAVALRHLTHLAKHPHPCVREGAVLGAGHMGPPAQALLHFVLANENNRAVRSVASELLSDLAEGTS